MGKSINPTYFISGFFHNFLLDSCSASSVSNPTYHTTLLEWISSPYLSCSQCSSLMLSIWLPGGVGFFSFSRAKQRRKSCSRLLQFLCSEASKLIICCQTTLSLTLCPWHTACPVFLQLYDRRACWLSLSLGAFTAFKFRRLLIHLLINPQIL